MLSLTLFLFSLMMSFLCQGQIKAIYSQDYGKHLLWTPKRGSFLWVIIMSGCIIGSLCSFSLIIWGFLHVHWYGVLLAGLFSLFISHLIERGGRNGQGIKGNLLYFFGLITSIAITPIISIVIWFLGKQ